MSGAGAPTLPVEGAEGLAVAIVAASWHEQVMGGLLAGALRACERAEAEVVAVVRVPGSFELPIVAQQLALGAVDAVIALGVVIRGGTPHFEFVCDAASSGLARVALETGVPVGFGLLTCDNEEQALERAGLPGSRESKGDEAACAALMTAVTLRRLREGGDGA